MQMKYCTTLIILSLCFSLWHIEPALSHSHTFNSIFSFGDSYTDTGNLNVLAKKIGITVPTDKLPYGETFFHHPSQRCSNGRLIVDFLAEEFGLPLLRPYLAKNGSFRHGANFAVAGATALEPAYLKQQNITTVAIPLNTSLNFQLQWFEELKPSLCQGTKGCRDYFGKSLFIIGEIGGNDYLAMFTSRLSMTKVQFYASTIVHTIAKTVKRVLDQGARTVVVPGNIPMGCLPMLLTIFKSRQNSSYDHATGCIKRFNVLSRYHNSLILKAIQELRNKYPHATIIYADYYNPVINFVKSPQRYGFASRPLVACCGKGGEYNCNTTEWCGLPNVPACRNPSTYISWDGVHLTEAAYRYISRTWLKGPFAHPPILDARTS